MLTHKKYKMNNTYPVNHNVALSPEQIESLLNDLYKVGPEKPLGYLPQVDITVTCKKEISDVSARCEEMGLKTLLLEDKDCQVMSGALYVYSEEALQQLIDDNARLIQSKGWPTDTAMFVKKCANTSASFNSDLYRLVAWAYADPRPEFQRPTLDSWTVPVAQRDTQPQNSSMRKMVSRVISRTLQHQ